MLSPRLGVLLSLVAASTAGAVDLGVDARKLIVIDRVAASDTAKLVFVSKDAAISKGNGTDVASIDATFDYSYDAGSPAGAFSLPAGASDGTSGWTVNAAAVAKYVNKAAPGGPTGAAVAVVKPGKLLKLVARTLGDLPLDVHGSAAPSLVHTAFAVTNGADTTRHCSVFPSCVLRPVAGGAASKLTCKAGTPDACPVGTTTTTVPPNNCMSEMIPGQGLACFGFCGGVCGCAGGGTCFLGGTPCSVSTDCPPVDLPCESGTCLGLGSSCTTSADCTIADACACSSAACACF